MAILYKTAGLFVGFLAISIPLLSFGMETYVISEFPSAAPMERFNNTNWFTMPHPSIASFSVFSDGSSEGITETGVPFKQFNVPNDVGLRIQRFEIEDHYHYIIDGIVVYDLASFSAEL